MYRYIYIYTHSSYKERIQREESVQYRKRRAVTVKVTHTSQRQNSTSQRAEVGMYIYM